MHQHKGPDVMYNLPSVILLVVLGLSHTMALLGGGFLVMGWPDLITKADLALLELLGVGSAVVAILFIWNARKLSKGGVGAWVFYSLAFFAYLMGFIWSIQSVNALTQPFTLLIASGWAGLLFFGPTVLWMFALYVAVAQRMQTPYELRVQIKGEERRWHIRNTVGKYLATPFRDPPVFKDENHAWPFESENDAMIACASRNLTLLQTL